ncbi:MAG: EAL domain-containing protein, partial [Sulfurimonadaceae bacterium]|nr:EAL domain-containing protein [Sulfurimonadaceae bacterium]
ELAKNEDAALTLYRLLNALSAPYNVEGHTITTISASIGVSMYPDDKVEAGALLRHADVAMYKSKNKGKNRFTFFDIVSDQKIKANYKTINRIKDSLETGEFCLYYQPKVNAVAGKIVEVEALARWNHPLLGLVSPAEFLPLVENDDTLSDQFDRWVVREAIEQLLSWQDEGLFIKICVNISPRQFRHRHFTQWLGELIDAIGVDRELLSYLEFEILETAAVESLDRSNEVIKECKALGITFALDDFGTGYSSMMHLKELHVDTIKIDRLFVTGMLENAANLVIVQAIVALGNAFDITVTAEGAERIDEVISLLEMGCDDIQGFAIARPMPKEELKEFVLGFEPDPRWKIASQSLPSKIDFELLLASSNHKYWLELVLEAFSDDTIDAQWLALDYSQCRFGKWFEKKRAEHYPMTPGFNDIDALHRQMHAYVKELYELLSSEKRKIKEDEKDTLLGMSKKLTTVLEEVRKEVVNVKKQSDLVNKILEKRRQYER